jgi:hypothetical protein
MTPQLYWATTKTEQAYPVLLEWWSGENTRARHLWPGNYTSRAGSPSPSAFPVSDLMEQIRATRRQVGATGNVHFSMKAFLTNQASMNDSLVGSLYAEAALIPPTTWLTDDAPPIPVVVSATADDYVATVRLSTTTKRMPWQWLVQLRTDGGWQTLVVPGGEGVVRVALDRLPRAMRSRDGAERLSPTHVTVRAYNRVGVESPPITVPVEPERAR